MEDDNILQKENLANTSVEVAKEVSGPTSKKSSLIPKKGSSGRGLYIAAIVLGIMILLLLILYIYLAFTHKSVAYTFFVPISAIARISNG